MVLTLPTISGGDFMANYDDINIDFDLPRVPRDTIIDIIMGHIDENDMVRTKAKLEDACYKFASATLFNTFFKIMTSIVQNTIRNIMSVCPEGYSVDDVSEYASTLLNENVDITGKYLSQISYDFIISLANRIDDPALTEYVSPDGSVFEYGTDQIDEIYDSYFNQNNIVSIETIASKIIEDIKTNGKYFTIDDKQYTKKDNQITMKFNIMHASVILNAIITSLLPGIALSLLLICCILNMGLASIVAAIIMLVSAGILRYVDIHSLVNDTMDMESIEDIQPIIIKQILSIVTSAILLFVAIIRIVATLL